MSTPSYRRVSPRFWRDPAMKSAGSDAQLLALYLLTCEQRRAEGLYALPRGYAAVDLEWGRDRLDAAWEKLVAIGFVEEDAEVGLVLLPKALRYQAVEVPNHVKSVVSHVASLPSSPLIERLKEVASLHSPKLATALGWEGGPAPERDPGQLPLETPAEPEPEAKPEPKPDTSKAEADETFETFWQSYPRRHGRREGKKKARAVWGRLSRKKREAAQVAVQLYAAACDEGLTLAKDAHRWLRDELWEEWDTPAVPQRDRREVNHYANGMVI